MLSLPSASSASTLAASVFIPPAPSTKASSGDNADSAEKLDTSNQGSEAVTLGIQVISGLLGFKRHSAAHGSARRFFYFTEDQCADYGCKPPFDRLRTHWQAHKYRADQANHSKITPKQIILAHSHQKNSMFPSVKPDKELPTPSVHSNYINPLLLSCQQAGCQAKSIQQAAVTAITASSCRGPGPT